MPDLIRQSTFLSWSGFATTMRRRWTRIKSRVTWVDVAACVPFLVMPDLIRHPPSFVVRVATTMKKKVDPGSSPG
jgi:hypothetical protein